MMDDAELARKAEKVIRGNRKPTVILSQAEAEALIAERDAARDAALEEAAVVAFSYGVKELLAEHKPYIIAAAIRAKKGKSHE